MSASFAPIPGDIPTSAAAAPPPPQAPRRFRRTYRGGFSSSICDLFSSPYDRSSFCALACCGFFLQDRNKYIVTGELPPPLWQRFLLNGAFFVVVTVLADIYFQNAFLGIIAACVALGVRGTIFRMRTRKQLMEQHMHETVNEGDGNFCADHRRAHRCCGFIPKDIIYREEQDDPSEDDEGPATQLGDRDSCFCLWRCLAASCCGCCGCWCNCCGICAIGQEDRELRRLFPKDKFLMDYITMQPYEEYYPAIENLRRAQDGSFSSHLQTMSRLSTTLVRVLEVGMMFLLAVSVFHIFKNFHVATVVVMVLTLIQAFAVVYLVHWRNHRFDLSLDLVVKFFGSGAILAMAVALIIEILTSIVGNIMFSIVFAEEYAEDNPTQTITPSDKELIYDIAQHHLPTLLTFVFFQAFVVAALIEELTKYFCFWMVEHPDLNFIPNDGVPARSLEGTAVNGGGSFEEEGESAIPATQSLHSKSAAITVGLVTTAAGFACSENLLYAIGAGSSFSHGVFDFIATGGCCFVSTLLLTALFLLCC